MTEYWKSQEKTFCDMCKCWLTDNKSSVEFHKNGKRHKENVEKRLRDIQKKNKVNEKKDKKFEQDMQRIERAAAAACEKEMDPADMSTQPKQKAAKEEADKHSVTTLNEPKILHREKEKKKPNNVASSSSSSSTSTTASNQVGSWQPVVQPTYVDLELPTQGSRVVEYEPRVTGKRKTMQFTEKTVISVTPTPLPSSSSWIKVEATKIEFKKRKFTKNNMRQRGDED